MTPAERRVGRFERAVRLHQAAKSIEATQVHEPELDNAKADLLKAMEQPTWLDRCAWAAMGGALSNPKLGFVTCAKLAEESYKVADAMLAEKQRREGAGGAK